MIFKQRFDTLFDDLRNLREIREWLYQQAYFINKEKLQMKVFNLIWQKKHQIYWLQYYLIKYSVFNLNEIGPILADIISKVEGVEYGSKYLKILESFAIKGLKPNINKIQFFYKKEECLIKNIYDLFKYDLLKYDDLFRSQGNEEIIKNSKLLKLYISNSYYFKINTLSNSLEEESSLIFSITEFDYINYFLEYAIDYRIENFIKNFEEDITIEELEMLKNDFLEETMNQTQETNEKRRKMARELVKKHNYFHFRKKIDFLQLHSRKEE